MNATTENKFKHIISKKADVKCVEMVFSWTRDPSAWSHMHIVRMLWLLDKTEEKPGKNTRVQEDW